MVLPIDFAAATSSSQYQRLIPFSLLPGAVVVVAVAVVVVVVGLDGND